MHVQVPEAKQPRDLTPHESCCPGSCAGRSCRVVRAEGDDEAALELALSPISDVIRVSCVYHCVSHWYHDHVNDLFGLIHVSQYMYHKTSLRAVSMSHV